MAGLAALPSPSLIAGPAACPEQGVRQAGSSAPITGYAPIKEDGLTWREIKRLQPGIELRAYEQDGSVYQGPTDVVVIFKDRAPTDFRTAHPNAIAVYSRRRRLAFVILKDMEEWLGLNRTQPQFQIALGRVIAHELEHSKRESHEHDQDGFFRSRYRQEDLLSAGGH